MADKILILIVEDDVSSAEMLVEMVGLAGYSGDTAGNLDEAVAAMEARSYGAVLLDLTLPGVSSDDLIRRLAAIGAKPPLVVFSARIPEELKAAAERLGAAAALQKPTSMETLLGTLARVVRHA